MVSWREHDVDRNDRIPYLPLAAITRTSWFPTMTVVGVAQVGVTVSSSTSAVPAAQRAVAGEALKQRCARYSLLVEAVSPACRQVLQQVSLPEVQAGTEDLDQYLLPPWRWAHVLLSWRQHLGLLLV